MKLFNLIYIHRKKVLNSQKIFSFLIILLVITAYPAYTGEPEIGYFALYFNGSR